MKTIIPPLELYGYRWYVMTTRQQPTGFVIHLACRCYDCDESGLWMGSELMSGTPILSIRRATLAEVTAHWGRIQPVSSTEGKTVKLAVDRSEMTEDHPPQP
ncbi:MAG: hypothetical protein WCQ21_20750 [Verrucomicrobiota bacterium]|jgi:hypothetical protein